MTYRKGNSLSPEPCALSPEPCALIPNPSWLSISSIVKAVEATRPSEKRMAADAAIGGVR